MNDDSLAYASISLGPSQAQTLTLISLQLSHLDIHVEIGDVLAVTLSTDQMWTSDANIWQSATARTFFAGAQGFWRVGMTDEWTLAPTTDGLGLTTHSFSTFVKPVPEPSTWLLTALGLAGLAWRRRNVA